ncbi:MAG TPA: lysophospholipid acyltransferase family protein [Chthoniobacterales bacterium]
MKIRLPEERVAGLIAGVIRLLRKVVRVRIDDSNGFLAGERRGPFIVAVWHNRILGLMTAGYHRTGIVPMTVLTSPSRDGEVLAQALAKLGVAAVRGSSSKRAAAGLIEAIRTFRAGRTMIVTPDGPRGPKYVLSPGVISLARKTGAPVLAVHVHFSRAWRLKTWDRFFVPLPFSRIDVKIDPARFFPETGDLELQRAELEGILRTGTGE